MAGGPLTIPDIISTILDRTKRLEICDTLHDAQIATTEEELISAGLPLVVYSYETGIIDDTLLASFTESKLNAVNIYTTGSFSLTNPTEDIYILKDAIVTVTMNGNNKCKINVCGAATLTLLASGKSYTFVKGYGQAVINATASENAIINISATETNTGTTVLNDNSICQLMQTGSSNLAFTANNSSYLNAKLFYQSILTYEANDTAIVEAIKYQSAQINTPET